MHRMVPRAGSLRKVFRFLLARHGQLYALCSWHMQKRSSATCSTPTAATRAPATAERITLAGRLSTAEPASPISKARKRRDSHSDSVIKGFTKSALLSSAFTGAPCSDRSWLVPPRLLRTLHLLMLHESPLHLDCERLWRAPGVERIRW